MLRIFVVCISMFALSTFGAAEEISKQEQLLRDAMSYDAKANVRKLDPGTVIRAYIKGGYVRRKPDYGVDYNDLREVRKPATLFGHKLHVLLEEYRGKTPVGCCVSPGIGMVIEQKGNLGALESFLTTNKCSIEGSDSPNGNFNGLDIPSTPGAAYFEISCRERDIEKE
jgi:hypothetical protein